MKPHPIKERLIFISASAWQYVNQKSQQENDQREMLLKVVNEEFLRQACSIAITCCHF
jgi:hypothetical protein